MADNQQPMDKFERTREKAKILPSDDGIRRIIDNAIDLFDVFIKGDANPKKLRNATKALKNERMRESNDERLPLHDLVDKLTVCIETTFTEIGRREENRSNANKIKMEAMDLSRGNDELFNTSEVGDINEEARIEEDGDPQRSSRTSSEEENSEESEEMNFSEGEEEEYVVDLNKRRHRVLLPYGCVQCDRRFKLKKSLDGHKISHSKELKRVGDMNECKICGKRFKKSYRIYRHIKSHSIDGNQSFPFECDQCDRRFKLKEILDAHKITHNWKRVGDMDECNFCGKQFTKNSTQIFKHLKTHADDGVKRPHKCDVCGRRFTTKFNLKQHAFTHMSNDDPRKMKYKCVVCGKTSPTASEIKKHEMTHLSNDDPGKKKYECEECGLKYNSRNNFNYHKLTHLSDEDPRKKGLKRKCEICGKVLSSSTGIARHNLTHNKKKKPVKPRVRKPKKKTKVVRIEVGAWSDDDESDEKSEGVEEEEDFPDEKVKMDESGEDETESMTSHAAVFIPPVSSRSSNRRLKQEHDKETVKGESVSDEDETESLTSNKAIFIPLRKNKQAKMSRMNNSTRMSRVKKEDETE